MDNEILNYKDLAALPKIKAIYEVQRPDLISYEPYHRYTSDETLERYSYGEVLRLQKPCWDVQEWPQLGAELWEGSFIPGGAVQGGRSRAGALPEPWGGFGMEVKW